MNVKRFFVLGVLGLFFVSMIGGVLAAEIAPAKAGAAVGESIGMVWEGGAAFFGALFGDTIVGNEILTRIFMTLLIAMFVYTALGSFFGKSKSIRWVATAAVSMLAMIGLPDALLISIRTGYSAMGTTILTVVPFLIIFWFSIKTGSLVMARLTWMFYTFYYFALMSSEWIATGLTNTYYLIAIALGLFAFFGILKMRDFIFKEEVKGLEEDITQGLAVQKVNREAAKQSDADKAGSVASSAK